MQYPPRVPRERGLVFIELALRLALAAVDALHEVDKEVRFGSHRPKKRLRAAATAVLKESEELELVSRELLSRDASFVEIVEKLAEFVPNRLDAGASRVREKGRVEHVLHKLRRD